MKTLARLRLTFTIGAGAVALLASDTVTVAVSQTTGGNRSTAQQIVKQAEGAYAALTSYSDEGKTVSTLKGGTFTTTFKIKLARPEFYRIEWEQPVHPSFTNKGVVWSSGEGDFIVMTDGNEQIQANRETALGGATGISGDAAATIPGTFFRMNWGNQLGASAVGKKRQADEKVGGQNCFVIESELKGNVTTLWIGENDFLIHQKRTVTSAKAMKAALAEAAKRNPEIAERIPKVEPQSNTSTETHFNIVVNQKFSVSDFAR
jgi:outer membrane lipoprotein-sorting protein